MYVCVIVQACVCVCVVCMRARVRARVYVGGSVYMCTSVQLFLLEVHDRA